MRLHLGSRFFDAGDLVVFAYGAFPPGSAGTGPEPASGAEPLPDIVEVTGGPGAANLPDGLTGVLPAASPEPAEAARWVRDGGAVLIGDELAAAAAATGCALVCTDPDAARTAGVRPDGLIVDAGHAPQADRVAALVSDGLPVLVSPAGTAEPELAATIAVYAWLGARVFRVRIGDVARTRQVLDMVGAIRGTRQPVLSRRALA